MKVDLENSNALVTLFLYPFFNIFSETYAGAKVLFITREGTIVEPLTDRILVVRAQIALF